MKNALVVLLALVVFWIVWQALMALTPGFSLQIIGG